MTPKEERGKVNGSTNFAGCIVMAVGSLVGGILYEHFSPRLPFFVFHSGSSSFVSADACFGPRARKKRRVSAPFRVLAKVIRTGIKIVMNDVR